MANPGGMIFCTFALFCAHLRVSANDRVWELQRLGTAEFSAFSSCRVANFENPTDRLHHDRPQVTGISGIRTSGCCIGTVSTSPPPPKTACVKVEDDHTWNHATTEKAGNRGADMVLQCHLAGKKGHTAVDCQSFSVPNASHQAQRQDYSSLKWAWDGLTHLIKDSHNQATPQQATATLVLSLSWLSTSTDSHPSSLSAPLWENGQRVCTNTRTPSSGWKHCSVSTCSQVSMSLGKQEASNEARAIAFTIHKWVAGPLCHPDIALSNWALPDFEISTKLSSSRFGLRSLWNRHVGCCDWHQKTSFNDVAKDSWNGAT